MAWIKLSEELYLSDQSPYSLEKIDGIWYVVDNSTQKKSIPFADIFNNPVFPIDYSNTDMLVKSLTSLGTIEGKHFRGESANTPATPAFSFQGDINSGIYRIDADKIGFSAGGSRQGEFGVGYGGFAGNIIQVISSEFTANAYTTNTNFELSGISASITPKYNNSKILILFSSASYVNNQYGMVSIYRNGISGVNLGNGIYGFATVGNYANFPTHIHLNYLDSPGTISTTSYNIAFRSSSGVGFYLGYATSKSIISLLEVQQ